MRLRDYAPEDRAACLALFDSNTPAFFAPSERADFADFLDGLACSYLLLEDAAGLAACGGWGRRRSDPQVADLCWGMVRRDLHGAGLGQRLLEARLQRMRAAGVRTAALETSQHSEGFFARFGFVTYEVKPDGFAPGLHLHAMRLDLA